MLLANWQRCVDHLREELPSQQFNTWIRPLQAEFSAEGLTLFAPNRFVQDWVKDKFYSRICELVQRQAGGESFDVFLEVGKKQVEEAAPQKNQSASPQPLAPEARVAPDQVDQPLSIKRLDGDALRPPYSFTEKDTRSHEGTDSMPQSVPSSQGAVMPAVWNLS
ncbi:MAG: DnaA N-terminal domain-containing protein [Pseudohongiella sp.]|nr:DnaA N-terminal domain-containing protein [Pseudohongiella sp.]